MIRSTNIPKMTKIEIEKFRSHMRDVMTGNVSEKEAERIAKNQKSIETTYKEFIKANGGKNPILGF